MFLAAWHGDGFEMVITQSERHPKKEITDFETTVELHVLFYPIYSSVRATEARVIVGIEVFLKCCTCWFTDLGTSTKHLFACHKSKRTRNYGTLLIMLGFCQLFPVHCILMHSVRNMSLKTSGCFVGPICICPFMWTFPPSKPKIWKAPCADGGTVGTIRVLPHWLRNRCKETLYVYRESSRIVS